MPKTSDWERHNILPGEGFLVDNRMPLDRGQLRMRLALSADCERQHNRCSRLRPLAVDRKEVVIVDLRLDRVLSDVLQAVREFHLGFTFYEAERLAVLVAVTRRSIAQDLEHLNRV